MLGGNTYLAYRPVRVFPQFPNHRSQLNHLRPSAEDSKHFQGTILLKPALGSQGTLSVPEFGQPVPQLDGPIPGLALIEANGGPQPGNSLFLLSYILL